MGVSGVLKPQTVSKQKGMVSSEKEMWLLGHRAEKLTSGCDNVVTGDLDQHSIGVEHRVEVQLEEMRRRCEAKPGKPQEMTL